jgi:hypothetical protein
MSGATTSTAGAVLHDVHQQFAVVAAGDSEFISSIGQELVHLLGVPAPVHHPAGALGGKPQHCGLVGLARKDALVSELRPCRHPYRKRAGDDIR